MDFNEYVQQGIEFFEARETDKAIENIEAALKIQPDNVQIRRLLKQLKQLKQDEDTREYYENLSGSYS